MTTVTRTLISAVAWGVTILTTVATVGCGNSGTTPEPETPEPETPEPVVTSVVVAPGTAELDFLGAAQQFTAEVRDAAGQAVQGASVTWSSSSPSVAVVNATGLATATGNGHTTIMAGVGSVSGGAQLTVSQKPASVVVATGHVVAEAGKQGPDPIVATVADGSGAPIAGMSYRWTTDRQSGWVFPSEGTTDAMGMIRASWVAGWPGDGLIRLMVDTMASLTREVNTTSTIPVSNPAGALNIRMNHQGRSAAYSIDITPLTEPPRTYYAAINWDGGYAGLQRAGSRYDRQLQFSVWDVPGVGGAEVIESGEGVICTGFGGEGTGRKCELNYPWSVGSTYRFEVTEREVNGGSAMTLHVTDIAARERRFVGTLWFARRTRMTGFTMFVEDFGHRSVHCLAQEVRSAAIRRSMALINNTWQALTQATLGRASRDSQNPGTPACANLDARSHSAGLEIVIGGENVRDPNGSLQLVVPN